MAKKQKKYLHRFALFFVFLLFFGVFVTVVILTGAVEWMDAHSGSVSAIASVMVAIFTFTLWRSTQRLWHVTNEQIVAANAPRIGVYQIEAEISSSPVGGSLFIINEGGTLAKLIGARIKPIISSEGLPQRFPAEDGVPLSLNRPEIEAGHAIRWDFSSDLVLDNQQVQSIEFGEATLFLFGIVRFDDLRGVRHRTIFCRRFDVVTNRWVPTDDFDYEYQT